jgi:hypothetical protein
MRIGTYICALAIAALSVKGMAQSHDELMRNAYLQYDIKNYQEAISFIEEAVKTRKGQTDELAWHIRGFIYKDMYGEKETSNRQSPARESAVNSFKKSCELDKENKLRIENHKALKYLAVSYYNDASDVLRERKPDQVDQAEKLYTAYKDITLFVYPDSNFRQNDILFYLSLATAHRKIYESNREKNEAHWHYTNQALDKVLDIEPLNFPANYSLAVSHYNKGAFVLEKLPEADGIIDIMRLQGESVRSIKVALPFMLKAFEINPESIEAVKGLKWITFNLDQTEEHEKFEQMYREMLDSKRNNH